LLLLKYKNRYLFNHKIKIDILKNCNFRTLKYLSMRILSFIAITLCFLSCKTQVQTVSKSITTANVFNEKPKLVVGIIVDQMRYDYLTRFYSKFGEGGFKRLLDQGFSCSNTHYKYIPTFTGPGQAAVYTGTTPKYNGIIANNWYDKVEKKKVYCVNDDAYEPVGTKDKYSKVSPSRMYVTTLSDELRLFTQQKGKVIGIALKDRGAVLPAGHSANGAYWFHGKEEGNWVTSTFYMNALPTWVETFNSSNKAESYFKTWNTLKDINTYTESGNDLNAFEGGFKGKETATFPYELQTLKETNKGFELIKATPFGNSLTADFALAAIDGEQLGQDAITDLLAVSFSSTDYVGHNFGVNSKEVQDTYMRLDKDIERLLNALDVKVGQGNYTLFLTADHAAVDVPSYLQSQKIPSGYYDLDGFKKRLNAFLTKTYGASDLLENASNFQVFLNRDKLQLLGLDLQEVQQAVVNEIIDYPHIDKAYTATSMSGTSFNDGIEILLQNGYNQKRSGDVLTVLDPAYISYGKTGSTHGSGQMYDTHVPLLFYGKGIKKGQSYKHVNITDIAPTMSALLGISFPNAATGKVLEFVLD
jgi:predicted AlkP superfamily pyrophosphatase or phosphodiesterase